MKCGKCGCTKINKIKKIESRFSHLLHLIQIYGHPHAVTTIYQCDKCLATLELMSLKKNHKEAEKEILEWNNRKKENGVKQNDS